MFFSQKFVSSKPSKFSMDKDLNLRRPSSLAKGYDSGPPSLWNRNPWLAKMAQTKVIQNRHKHCTLTKVIQNRHKHCTSQF